MKRNSFDDRRDLQIADEHMVGVMPCEFCGAQTEWETLSQYGARCGPCFTQYCTGGKKNPPMPSREEKTDILLRLKSAIFGKLQGPRAWAYKLKSMEDAGVSLTRTQSDAWRVAIPSSPTEAASE